MWFANDSTAAGRIITLRKWWRHLAAMGPKFGYHPNPGKTTLMVKQEFYDEAAREFEGTGIKLSIEGQKLLGSAIGTVTFFEEDIGNKVKE